MVVKMNLRDIRKQFPDMPKGCQECRLFLDGQHYKIPRRVLQEGNKDYTLLLVCMNPGQQEDKKNEILVGPTGKAVEKLIGEFVDEEVHIVATNAVKCFAAKPSMTKQSEIPKRVVEKCAPFFIEDMINVNPDVILLMGKTAQMAWDVIEDEIEWHGQVVKCHHPSYILYGGSPESVVDGLRRADAAVRGQLVVPPTTNNLEQVLRQAQDTKRLGLDFEWDPATMKVHTIGLATKDFAWAGQMQFEHIQLLKRMCSDPSLTVFGHDLARAEIQRLIEFGVKPQNKWKDSMVMMWEVRDGVGRVSLDHLAYNKLLIEKYWWDDIDYSHYYPRLGTYCAKDAWVSLYLGESIEEEYTTELEAMREVHELDMALLYPMAMAMHKGIGLDTDKVAEHYKTIGERLAVVGPQLLDKWGCEATKAASILSVLQTRFNLRARSTKKDVLQALLDSTESVELVQFLTEVLEFRELYTLYTRYLVGLPSLVQEDGRIHPYLQTAKTNTGRPASSSPNVLNLPESVRDMFTTIYGDDGELVSRDRSQSEYRCAVYLSGHEELIQSYMDGVDMHSWAAELVGIDRRPAKTLNFGALYYAKDAKLMAVLIDAGLTSGRARTALKKYRTILSAFTEWQEQLIQESQAQGYVVAPDGGRGYRLKPTNIVNYPVQRWSATLNKKTLMYFFNEFQTQGLESHIWLDYYDSVETDQIKGERKIIDEIAESCFQELPDILNRGIKIPFPMETKYHGSHWGGGE